MIILYLLIISGIFVGDYLIKTKIEKQETEGKIRKVLGGSLLIRKHHNRGIALNVGSKVQPFVAALSLVIAIICTVLFCVSLGTRGSVLLRMGLSLLLGGAYSNTYDRLRRKYVVDYVSFNVPFGKLKHIVFNISDFCIIIGALLSVLATDF